MPNLPFASKKPLLLALLSAGVFAASAAHAADDSSTSPAPSVQENAAGTDARSSDATAGSTTADMKMSAEPAAESAGASGSTGSSDTSLSSQDKDADSSGTSSMGSDSQLSDADEDLMQQITQANLAEIMNAQLALDKSDDAEVKKFAKQMLDDHTAAQADLTKLAQDKGGVKLPTQPNAEQKMEYDKLSAMSGEDFDKAYMKRAGVQDHQKVHASLEQAEQKAKDKDLQAYISDTKETVADHLKMAKEMHDDSGVRSGESGTAGSMDTGAGASGDKADEAAGASTDKR